MSTQAPFGKTRPDDLLAAFDDSSAGLLVKLGATPRLHAVSSVGGEPRAKTSLSPEKHHPTHGAHTPQGRSWMRADGRTKVSRAIDQLLSGREGRTACLPKLSSAGSSPDTAVPPGASTLDFLDAQVSPGRIRANIRAAFQGSLAEYASLAAAVKSAQEVGDRLRLLPGVGQTTAQAVTRALRDARRISVFLNAWESRHHTIQAPPAAALPVTRDTTDCDDIDIPTLESWTAVRHVDLQDELGPSPEEQRDTLLEQLRHEIVRRRIAETAFLQIQSSVA